MLTSHSSVPSLFTTASQYKLARFHSCKVFRSLKAQTSIRSSDDDGLPSKVGRRKRRDVRALISSEIAEALFHAEDGRDLKSRKDTLVSAPGEARSLIYC